MREKQHRGYVYRLLITDTVVIALSLVISYFAMFDDINLNLQAEQGTRVLTLSLSPIGRAVLLGAAWLVALSFAKSRDRRVVGSGSDEYKRVFNASIGVLGALAMAALFFKLDVSRLFVAMGLILGTLALLVSRWAWRKWLRGRRAQGIDTNPVAIQGPVNLVKELVERLKRDNFSIYAPALLIAKTKSELTALGNLGIPVTLGFDDPAVILSKHNLNGLILVGSDNLSSGELKRVSWNLERTDAQLIVAPGTLEASGPRIHTRPVAGMPLIEIESPRFSGPQYFVKTAFDLTFSIFAIVLTLPVTLIVALAIFIEDPGPIFFRHTRIGRHGKPFKMWKFRSMHVGADKKFDELRAQAGYETNSVQFKLKNDPRITKVGKVIRKYSIDELPQFMNVLAGQMSVVGPRPHVQTEVDMYGENEERRLFVKPGLTGPWQVSGRSSLSWEDSVRLDLDYVENWSFAGDLVLISKTLGTVVRAKDAF